MKNKLNEKFILIIFLFTIIFVIVAIILGTRAPAPSSRPAPILQASPLPGEQPQQTIVSTNIAGQTFRVIEPVILNFAQPQATPSVSIKIQPDNPFVVRQLNPISISIEPEQVWRFDTTYDLRVDVGGRSFNFTFQTEERRGI